MSTAPERMFPPILPTLPQIALLLPLLLLGGNTALPVLRILNALEASQLQTALGRVPVLNLHAIEFKNGPTARQALLVTYRTTVVGPGAPLRPEARLYEQNQKHYYVLDGIFKIKDPGRVLNPVSHLLLYQRPKLTPTEKSALLRFVALGLKAVASKLQSDYESGGVAGVCWKESTMLEPQVGDLELRFGEDWTYLDFAAE